MRESGIETCVDDGTEEVALFLSDSEFIVGPAALDAVSGKNG